MTKSLREFKSDLLAAIRGEDVSAAEPRHDAFEVEVLAERKNYSFVLDRAAGVVRMYDTSRGAGNSLKHTFGPAGHFPLEQEDAAGYFTHLYRKALAIDGARTFAATRPNRTFDASQEA